MPSGLHARRINRNVAAEPSLHSVVIIVDVEQEVLREPRIAAGFLLMPPCVPLSVAGGTLVVGGSGVG